MKHAVRWFTTLMLFMAFVIPAAQAGDLDERLIQVMLESSPDEMIPAYLTMADQVNLEALKSNLKANHATLAHRHETVITQLQDKAATTQQDLLSFLDVEQQLGNVDSYRSMWIGNYVILTAKPAILEQIALRSDVEMVYYDAPVEMVNPNREYQTSERDDDSQIRSIEGGLVDINAPMLWAEGVTGEGRIVANFDTGVDGNHPGLAPKWRGNNGAPAEHCWLDVTNGTPFPNAVAGAHGTHVMGTICGSNDATGDTVGVAIDALWIAAGANLQFSTLISDCITAFQWASDPDGDPETLDDVPDVINNSWGDFGCNTGFDGAIDGIEAAGVVVVFAAGNEGPGAQTIRAPANRIASEVNVLAVGALNPGSSTIASFSSRGPSQCSLEPGQPDSLLIKPEVCARGVDVRSTVPGGGYEGGGWSGTSMAAPHVAGAVALLRQINPEAPPDEIKWALINSAVDMGEPGNENTHGFGRIDVYAASQLLGGHVEGFVTLEGADHHDGVDIWSTVDPEKHALTDSLGHYRLSALSEGMHTLKAKRMGFYDTEVTDVQVTMGETMFDINFSMEHIDYQPLNVEAQSELSQIVPLTWEAPEEAPAHYNIYRGTEPGGPYEMIAEEVTETAYDDTDVTNGHTYFYTVTAVYVDPSGESEYSNEAMGVPGIRYDLPLESDFEQNNADLYQVVIEPGEDGGQWVWGPVAVDHGPGGAASGANVWAVSTTENYANNVDVYLLTQLLDLTEVGSPMLSFDHWYEFEATTTGQTLRGFDGGNVAISTNAGDTWTIVEPVDGYDDAGVPGLDQEPGFSSSSEEWLHEVFDLTEFVGRVVTLRFRVGSDAGVNMAGWFIDNLSLVDALAIEDDEAQPTVFSARLDQNYPNPFNPSTTIAFSIPAKQALSLQIYNVSGQLVKTLVNRSMEAGTHRVSWDGSNDLGGSVTSGVYFYRLKTDGFESTKRMVLLK